MRLLPIALGLPGTIGFPTAIAHHRSPHRQVTEVSYAGKNIIAYHPSHGNAAPTSRMDCFVDSLLVQPGGKKNPFRVRPYWAIMTPYAQTTLPVEERSWLCLDPSLLPCHSRRRSAKRCTR